MRGSTGYLILRDKKNQKYYGTFLTCEADVSATGRRLLRYYDTFEKVYSLISGGKINFLGKTIDSTSDLVQDSTDVTRYDRKHSTPDVFFTETAMQKHIAFLNVEYVYLFDEDVWNLLKGFGIQGEGRPVHEVLTSFQFII